MKKLNESGRSMIEMLGVLSIIGILTVGGYGLVSKMQRNQRMNEVADNLVTLARKARQVSRDYFKVGDHAMCGDSACTSYSHYIAYGRAFPDTLTFDNDSFVDRNDVRYTVRRIFADGYMFMITVSGIDEQTCMHLATMNYGTPSTTGYKGMVIGVEFSALNGVNQFRTQQKTIGEAVTECTGKSVIHFAFR